MAKRAAQRRNATPDEIVIANPGDLTSTNRLWYFEFGPYTGTHVYVWADGEEAAFEIAVEWLDDEAPGFLVNLTEKDLREAAEDEGIEWQPSWPDFDDRKFQKVVEAAEADLTMIGHTTLKHGQYIRSDDWRFSEVTDDADRDEIAVQSFEDDGADMLNIDYQSEGPDKKDPTNALRVERNGGYVDISEWTDMYAATGEPADEGDVLRQDARVDLYELLDPTGKHRGIYSGDAKAGLGEILLLEPRDQEKAVVAAAISWMAYHGGEESHVSYVGE